MELETFEFVARTGIRVLLVMSAICVIGTAIWIFRIYRESRNARAARSPSLPIS
jgi:hypothetical protein